LDHVAAQVGAHTALFDHRRLGRQRARAQQRRQRASFLHGEAARDLARPAGDGFADDGRAKHLAVQHDREGPAHVGLRDGAEFARAAAVEAEIDDGLARLRIETRAGIRQPVAAQGNAVAHGIAVALAVLQGADAVRAGGVAKQVEAHLGG
jgi:hypothetical protein